MKTIRICPQCQQTLPPDAPEGLCPSCLVKAGLDTHPEPGSIGAAGAGEAPRRGLPTPGEQFGGYHILRELGRGGMGAVYEAEQLESGRRVALKVLGHKLDSADARARFLREGRLAASINHPNSVYVYGTEEIDGTPAIAMELIAGGTLQERVQRSGSLSVGEAVDAILQVIAGLEAARALGILHRDIKPSNCFEDADGTVKIGDFGLSISTEARGDTNLTLHGAFLGTPHFSSPEQLRGEELNVRSDMYSVGVTLFFLLTGRTPFEGKNMVQLLANVLEQPAPSPRKFRADIPTTLASAVLRCLEKQANDRFKTYDELRQALAPFSSEAPVPAPLLIRLVAGLVDSILLGTLGAIIGLTTGQFGFKSFVEVASQFSPKFLSTIATAFVVMLAYYAVLEGFWGASLGKALCRLRVTGPDRNPPGIAKAFARALIYLLLPPLPYWLLYGFNPYGFMIGTDQTVAFGISLLYYVLLASLFCTARRRNGLAAVHDLLTGTRVVRKPSYQARPVLASGEDAPVASETKPRVGPYHVIEPLESGPTGEWLLGYDTRLLRRVWLRTVPPGTPPITPPLRNLGRVGRLRWLAGRRTTEENWDAYEAAKGKALLTLIQRPQPWSQVRFWLLDLAQEVLAAEKDGTLPVDLDLDRVCITGDGRAKMLDFPAPGATPGTAAVRSGNHSPQDFLNRVARAALGGTTAVEPALRQPLPLHALAFLEKLPELANAQAVVAALKALRELPASVSRGRRAALLAGCLAFPLMAGLGFIVSLRVLGQLQQGQSELTELSQVLQFRATTKMPLLKKQPHPDDRAYGIYIASHFRPVITNANSWSNFYAFAFIKGEGRRFAEQSVTNYAHPTEQEIREATKAVEAHLPKTSGLDFARKPWFPLVAAGGTLLIYVCLPALIAALCFKGGLVLRVCGVAVVRKDGTHASRLRVFWRCLVAWAPLISALAMAGWLTPVLGAFWTGAMACVLPVGCAAVSLAIPDRSLQDRFAGTCLVPR